VLRPLPFCELESANNAPNGRYSNGASMTKTRTAEPNSSGSIQPGNAATGIADLDELTSGGLPRGRPTLVCGGAGSGKTVLGLETLVRGATQYGEPGAIFTFEESSDELAANVASFGFDLTGLIAQKKLIVDHLVIEPSESRGDGRLQLGRSFHPTRPRDRRLRRQACFARHDRGSLRGTRQTPRLHMRGRNEQPPSSWAVMDPAAGGGGVADGVEPDFRRFVGGRAFWELRLHAAGRTPRGEAALAKFTRGCELHLYGRYSVAIVDLRADPRSANDDQILALPTLVRRLPVPIKKLIGDLSSLERVLVGLELKAHPVQG
jgi:KaiC protein/KaiB-like protein